MVEMTETPTEMADLAKTVAHDLTVLRDEYGEITRDLHEGNFETMEERGKAIMRAEELADILGEARAAFLGETRDATAMDKQFSLSQVLNDLTIIADDKIALWKDGTLSTRELADYLDAMAKIEETVIV